MVLKKLSGFPVHIMLECLVLVHDYCKENAMKENKKDSATYQTSWSVKGYISNVVYKFKLA